MGKYRLFLLCTAILWLMAGCRPEIGFVDGSFRPGSAEISPSGGNLSIVFPATAGSASVDLEASGKWSATFVNERAKDWCSISTESGKRGTATITVSVKDNPDYDQRSASIHFVCGDVQRTINVTQKQSDALILNSNRLEIGPDGGEISIPLKTNVDFRCEVAAEDADWIRHTQTKSLETKTLVFQIQENTRKTQREGSVRITSSAGQELIKIYQQAMVPTLILGSSSTALPSDAGTFEVEVSSNVDVTVRMPSDAPWLKEVQSKSMSTNRYVFSVDANESYDARETSIQFDCPAENLSERFQVRQAQKDAVVISGNDFEVDAEGGMLEIRIAHNISYSVVVENTWIHQPTTKSFVEDVLLFEIEANQELSARTGTIRISSSVGTEVIHIRQRGEEPFFRMIPLEKDTLSYEAGVLTILLEHNVSFRSRHYGLTNMDVLDSGSKVFTDLSPRLFQMTIAYTMNKTRSVREAVVQFWDDSRTYEARQTIYQAPIPIVVSGLEIFVPSVASEFSFRLAEKSLDLYRVENVPDWIQLVSRREEEGGAVYRWKTKDYAGSAMREAQIRVYREGFEEPEIFHVYQEGSGLSFSVTYSSQKVKAHYIFGTFAEQSTLWWGDGNSAPYAGGTEHSYNASGNHTITIATNRMPYIERAEVKELEEGMHIDFSKMRGRN